MKKQTGGDRSHQSHLGVEALLSVPGPVLFPHSGPGLGQQLTPGNGAQCVLGVSDRKGWSPLTMQSTAILWENGLSDPDVKVRSMYMCPESCWSTRGTSEPIVQLVVSRCL